MIPRKQPDYTAHWEGSEEGVGKGMGGLYICPAGFPTIGYGHRITGWSMRDFESVAGDTNAYRLADLIKADHGQWMSEQSALMLLQDDLEQCSDRLVKLLGFEVWRTLLGTPRLVVLLDWCLNTGGGSMPGFREAVRSAALATGDPLPGWALAHDELLYRRVGEPEPSAYALVRPERAELNAKVILTGEWPT